jgi:hypothetical protein
MKTVICWLFLFCLTPAFAQTPAILGKDWKRAIWLAPPHILLSAPVAAVTVIVPPIGKKYVCWRVRAEQADAHSGRDTSGKAAIDLYSQTALPVAVLKIYRIKVR